MSVTVTSYVSRVKLYIDQFIGFRETNFGEFKYSLEVTLLLSTETVVREREYVQTDSSPLSITVGDHFLQTLRNF